MCGVVQAGRPGKYCSVGEASRCGRGQCQLQVKSKPHQPGYNIRLVTAGQSVAFVLGYLA